LQVRLKAHDERTNQLEPGVFLVLNGGGNMGQLLKN